MMSAASSSVVLVMILATIAAGYEWDSHGYVLYCPCMGRFGNQAAHFLGALAFARDLNRTLTLPPWRTYVRQRNVPFSEWFKVEVVQEYHKSLPLEDFMAEFGAEKWPPGKRIGYCYRARDGENGCEMKRGNPFGPFWDGLGVDFDGSEFTQLSYSTQNKGLVQQWMNKYPPDKHPIIALRGAPASFPVERHNRHLQRYLQWSDAINSQAEEYIREMQETKFIGVHLRIGSDWVRACEHAIGRQSFMESLQCLEDTPEATITVDICNPSREKIASDITTAVDKTGIKAVFVASDVDPQISDLQQRLGSHVKVYYLNPERPQVDLAILGKSDFFIGNCVSSFTAFVKRERDISEKPSTFFGVTTNLKEEL